MKEPLCHCIPVYLRLHIDLTVTYGVAGNSCHVVFDTILTQVCSFHGDAHSVAKAGVLLQEQEHVGTESVHTKLIRPKSSTIRCLITCNYDELNGRCLTVLCYYVR